MLAALLWPTIYPSSEEDEWVFFDEDFFNFHFNIRREDLLRNAPPKPPMTGWRSIVRLKALLYCYGRKRGAQSD
jgi:hypothetical protein